MKNREIKFRFWNKHDNSISEVKAIHFFSEALILYGGKFSEHSAKIRDGILMQYTGLKDKNGKEIYEGDIVSDDKTLFEVNMNVQQGKWWINPIKQIGDKQEEWFILALDNQQLGNGYYSRKDLEVIGNTHENPDIL